MCMCMCDLWSLKWRQLSTDLFFSNLSKGGNFDILAGGDLSKGDNICDFLFASFYIVPLSKKQIICILSTDSSVDKEGKVVPSLQVYPFSFKG